MNPTSLESYAQKLINLRTDRQGDRPRPHKAVMLLSVMTLAESGHLSDGRICYSPDLLEIFVRFMLDDVILVDAAHLIPFAESHDDSPNNGMALCKNHHWLMDRHLIAPAPGRGDNLNHPVWLISPLLDDRLEAHRACVEYRGRRVILPREVRHYPSPEALSWRASHLRI